MLTAPCKHPRRMSENRRVLAQALLEEDVYDFVYKILVEDNKERRQL